MARHPRGLLDAVFETAIGFLWRSNSLLRRRPTSIRRSEPFRFASQDDGKEPAVTVEMWQPSPEWHPPVVRDSLLDAPSRDLLAELRDEAVQIAKGALARQGLGGTVTASELNFVRGVVEKLIRGHREVPLVLTALIEE